MTRKFHPHHEIGGLAGLTLEDFWIWAFSDVLNNTVRGPFAEFMVGFALGCLYRARVDWDSVTFRYRDRAIAVKSAAFVQSSPQTRKTKISFDIGKKVEWDTEANRRGKKAVRTADCYIFALFVYEDFKDKAEAAAQLIDTRSWVFYVIPTKHIDKHLKDQKSVGLKWLDANCGDGPVQFHELKRRVDQVLGFEP